MGDRSINIFRVTAVVLLALAFVFIQAAFQWPRRLLGTQIDLLPALMVFTSLHLGIGSVIALSFIAGLSMDALSLNPLGVSPLPLCVIGMVLHLKREQILRDAAFAQVILGMAASALAPLGTLLMILTAGETPLLTMRFLWDLVVLTILGGIATPWIFRLMSGLEHALTYKMHSQPTFRPDREIRRGRH